MREGTRTMAKINAPLILQQAGLWHFLNSRKAQDTSLPMKYIVGLILLAIALILLIMLYVGWIPSPDAIVNKLVGIIRR